MLVGRLWATYVDAFVIVFIIPTLFNGAEGKRIPRKVIPVKVAIYYESLCPYSQSFITEQVGPAWKDLGRFIDIDLVPFGNANEFKSSSGKWNFTCQHGPPECYGNMVQACYIKKVDNKNRQVRFVECAMGYDDTAKAGGECAGQLGEEYDTIDKCVNSAEGSQYVHEFAAKTQSLDPPLALVPWVVINEVYSQENQDLALNDFRKAVCNNFGGMKPKCCSIMYME